MLVCQMSFHSIDFPSEWGLSSFSVERIGKTCFHSIDFPSEWGPTRSNTEMPKSLASGFHSIDFPSEWGLLQAAYGRREQLPRFPFN